MINKHWKPAPSPALSLEIEQRDRGTGKNLLSFSACLCVLVSGMQLTRGPPKRKARWKEFLGLGGAVRG